MDTATDQHNPEALFEKAEKAIHEGECHNALAFYRKSFHYGKNPEYAHELVKLAGLFMKKELWREAEEAVLEALRVAPDLEEAGLLLKNLHAVPDRFCDIKPYFDAETIRRHREKTVISTVPRIQLFIELTNMCNGACVTCLNRKMKRKRGIMDLDLFKKIVDESTRSLYLEMVHLYGVGEDYLISDVMEYFNYAIKMYAPRGIQTVLITNGERITDLPEGISVIDISFNGGTTETYERITGINFDRTVNNIWRLERQGQLNSRRNIHMLVYDDNAHEVEEFKKLFAFTGATLVMAYKYDNQCGELADKTLAEFRSDQRIPCHYVRNVLNIGWNGDVILCPHDFDGVVNYGNVSETSITDIWHGKLHREMLHRHAGRSFEGLCENCNFNLPIEGKNIVVSRNERIELRKKYLDYALKHMVRCNRAGSCTFVKQYRENIEVMEKNPEEPLIRICSDDYRFYGVNALMRGASHECPELSRLKKQIHAARVCWEAPTFGPSGYAFAARGYMNGLADAGVRLRVQPIWGDCTMEFDGERNDE